MQGALIDLRRNAPNKVDEADGAVGERDAAERGQHHGECTEEEQMSAIK